MLIPTAQERLSWYYTAERKILRGQEVETADGEKLTRANLGQVRAEIARLEGVVHRASQGGRRSMIRRNYLE
jgi:flagella basal body P-ring formation protein FlgA